MFIYLRSCILGLFQVVYRLGPFTRNLQDIEEFLCQVQLALVPGLRVGFLADTSSTNTPSVVGYQNPTPSQETAADAPQETATAAPQDQDRAARRAPRAINPDPVRARMRIHAQRPYIEIHLFHINLYHYAFQCGAVLSGFISGDYFFNDLTYTKRIALKVKSYFSSSESKKGDTTPSIKEMQDEVSNGYKTTTTASTTEIPKEVPPGPVGGG